MNFDNTEIAYKLKTYRELCKAFYIYKLLSNSFFVFFGSKVVFWFLKLKVPISVIFKYTFFKQFCAGINKQDSIKIVNKLKSVNVKSYMHYASEVDKSKIGINLNLNKTLETILLSKDKESTPFTVFKLTSLGDFNLFEKKSSGISLTTHDKLRWNELLQRIHICCKQAIDVRIRVLIDAEESWVQNAIDEIAENLIETYNKKDTYIFTTIQMYRKDRLAYTKKLFKRLDQKGIKFGVKLVRGAYIKIENNRAKESNLSSPIFKSKIETDISFDAAIDFILPRVDKCNLFLGTHNESSTIKVIRWMRENNISNDYPCIWFSQLYGMSDHISFNLASFGYQVVKYLPYGPVQEVIPYLIRRVEENTSVIKNNQREINLIKIELNRRKLKEMKN